MKVPLSLTLVIVIACFFWNWRQNQYLTVLQERQRKELAEAEALGIPADSSLPFLPMRSSDRHQGDSRSKVKELADRMVTLFKEEREFEKCEREPDEASQKRMMGIDDDLDSLNCGELKMLVGELLSRADMDEMMKDDSIGYSIRMLALKLGESALAIFTEFPDLMKDKHSATQYVLRDVLTHWAQDQPLAAMDWIKKNAGKYPDLASEDTKLAILAGAAQRNFGVAFQMMGELKTYDHSPVLQIAQAANTPEKQTAYLEALRTQVQNISDPDAADKLRLQGMWWLFPKVFKSSFDQATTWLEAANLSPKEMEQFGSPGYSQTKEDTGKWLDWFSAQPSPAAYTRAASQLVSDWTHHDYKAAGEWLSQTPAGPIKEAVTMAYLQSVAPYDPESAVLWANTLPVEKQKDALRQIYQALKSKDPVSAEGFAKRQGLGGH